MRRTLPLRSPLGMSRRKRLIIAASGIGAILALFVVVMARSASEAQPKVYAQLWPPFTMVFSVRDIDPATGDLVIDQTWRLTVQDEYHWRKDLTRDALQPDEVGSYAEWNAGVLTEYSAQKKYTQRLGQSAPRTVTTITEELNPTLLLNINDNREGHRGWQAATAQAPGRVAKTRVSNAACVPPPRPQAQGPLVCRSGQTMVPTETRVEWTQDSIRSPYVGGVAVFGERRVNGVVVHSFRSDSLEVR
ncbi:MAG: hypothetical protein HYX51_07105 [Chloroflexi bacterium]|nr:hypothetical protein [Chloroflexota bacterium]